MAVTCGNNRFALGYSIRKTMKCSRAFLKTMWSHCPEILNYMRDRQCLSRYPNDALYLIVFIAKYRMERRRVHPGRSFAIRFRKLCCRCENPFCGPGERKGCRRFFLACARLLRNEAV